jgi:hypothetical protein
MKILRKTIIETKEGDTQLHKKELGPVNNKTNSFRMFKIYMRNVQQRKN